MFLLISFFAQAQPTSEQCDNQIDDDQDGFIDLFDPDCPCDSNAYQAICPIECEFLPNRYPSTQLQLAWKSALIGNKDVFTPNILVGDVNNDGATEIVVRKTIAINNDENESYIAILKGTDGSLINEFQVSGPNTINQSRELMAMADINRDSLAEFVLKGDNTMKVFNLSGQLIAQSDSLLINEGKHINLADFNGDGIVEAYLGASIYNTLNGKLITYSNLSSGKNPIEYLSGITYSEEEHSIAADLLPEAGLELAAGNMVYKIDINNTNDTSGNTMSPVVANDPVKDGFTAVADINGDQQLDVVVVRGSNKEDNGGIWVWDPRTQEIIAFAYDMFLPLRGSVPFIGDLQGDCTPEIGIAFQGQLRLYQYTGSDTLDRLYSLSTQDVSGMTNMTMFDFNQDGINELIFRDGEYLRIIDARTGGLIHREELESGTWTESPVVADVDHDGQAELLVNGVKGQQNDQYIYCFESSGAPWAPARNVWNQSGYHVTNINDDLSIPTHIQNQAVQIPGADSCLRPTCPAPYNSFNAQATYRTQSACIQIPAYDLSMKVVGYNCTPDSLFFQIVIKNQGHSKLTTDKLYMTLYSELPPSPSRQLAVMHFPFRSLDSSGQVQQSDTLQFSYPLPVQLEQIYFTINDPGGGANPNNFSNTGIGECDYENNTDSIQFNFQNPHYTYDSISICEGESITYRDSTLSIDRQYVFRTNSCDSAILLDLQVSQKDTVQMSRIICQGDSIFFGNAWLSTEGRYEHTLQNAHGCDSLLSLDLDISAMTEEYDTLILCGQDSVYLFGEWHSEEGTIKKHFQNAAGCDSTVTYQIYKHPKPTSTLNESLCIGRHYLFNGRILDSTGTYVDTLGTEEGCDSIVQLNLQFRPPTIEKLEAAICAGQSYDFNGRLIDRPGIYYDTIALSNCDIIYELHLSEADSVNTALSRCGNTLTSNAQNATYQWLNCAQEYSPLSGENTPSFTADEGGSYAVEITQNGCIDTSDCVRLQPLREEVVLYPNPSEGMVNISLARMVDQARIIVYNSLGQKMISRDYTDTDVIKFRLPVPQAVYFVVLEAECEEALFRVIRR